MNSRSLQRSRERLSQVVRKLIFLCNKMHTERKLQDLLRKNRECGNVPVVLVFRSVADLAGKPVVAASNLTTEVIRVKREKSCDAFAQVIWNITGVCPVNVDCSKSLVNGQCGREQRMESAK